MMTKQHQATTGNPEELAAIMHDIAGRSQNLVKDFMDRQAADGASSPPASVQQMAPLWRASSCASSAARFASVAGPRTGG